MFQKKEYNGSTMGDANRGMETQAYRNQRWQSSRRIINLFIIGITIGNIDIALNTKSVI